MGIPITSIDSIERPSTPTFVSINEGDLGLAGRRVDVTRVIDSQTQGFKVHSVDSGVLNLHLHFFSGGQPSDLYHIGHAGNESKRKW